LGYGTLEHVPHPSGVATGWAGAEFLVTSLPPPLPSDYILVRIFKEFFIYCHNSDRQTGIKADKISVEV